MATIARGLKNCARLYCGETHGACSHDGDHVARRDGAIQDTDFVAGRHDVTEHQQLFVRDARGNWVRRRITKRHPHELGLRAINKVPKNPSAAIETLAETSFATESTDAAR